MLHELRPQGASGPAGGDRQRGSLFFYHHEHRHLQTWERLPQWDTAAAGKPSPQVIA